MNINIEITDKIRFSVHSVETICLGNIDDQIANFYILVLIYTIENFKRFIFHSFF